MLRQRQPELFAVRFRATVLCPADAAALGHAAHLREGPHEHLSSGCATQVIPSIDSRVLRAMFGGRHMGGGVYGGARPF